MFGKTITYTVNFLDLENNKIITSDQVSGKANRANDYDPADTTAKLIGKGYELVNDGYGEADTKTFAHEDKTFKITFRHHHIKVDKDHLYKDFTKDKLQKTVKQIVHYQGAASRTPENSVTELTFYHVFEVDQVTGEVVNDHGYQPAKQSFMLIGTPTLPGFIPDKVVVGGKTISADDGDQEYTVSFKINRQPSELTQTAKIEYVDLNNDNRIIASDKLSGQPNLPIEYDAQAKIDQLKTKGFSLVNNGFNNDGDVQFFGNSDSYEPVFIITMKYNALAVNTAHPKKGIDPSLYQKINHLTVKFIGAGDQTPKSQTQAIHWQRTITVMPDGQVVTDGLYDQPWQPLQKKYDDIKVPVIAGYHTEHGVVKSPAVQNNDQMLTVAYQANGRIIPVDEQNQPISGAPQPQFETDDHDASKIKPDEIVPKVDGYHCDLMTVTPEDPGQNLMVTYQKIKDDDTLYINVGTNDKPAYKRPEQEPIDQVIETPQATKPEPKQIFSSDRTKANANEAAKQVNSQTKNSSKTSEVKNKTQDQVAIVNFIDLDHNGASLTSSGPLVGKPGDSINDLYSTEVPLKVIKKAGYRVIFNNFDKDGFIQRFDNNSLMTQVFTIGLSKQGATLKPETQATAVSENVQTQDGKTKAEDLKPKIDKLEQTKSELEKIQPTLVTKDGGNNQTVNRLLDIITALLNLTFVLGKNNDREN